MTWLRNLALAWLNAAAGRTVARVPPARGYRRFA